MTLSELQALLGEQVVLHHHHGYRFEGELVGVVDQPSVMVKTEDGEVITYSTAVLDEVVPRGN